MTVVSLTEPKEWPGLTSASWQYGDTIEAERPVGYFDPRERADRASCVLEPLPEAYGEAIEENASTLAEIEAELVDDAATLKRERAKFRRRCTAMQKRIDPRTADKVEEILDVRKRSKDPGMRKLAGAEAVKKASRLKRGKHPFGGQHPRFVCLARRTVQCGRPRRRAGLCHASLRSWHHGRLP